MKRIFLILCILSGIAVFSIGKAGAQDLVFEFKNPAFGGNTFNYQWMLSSADAQNTFEEQPDLGTLESDPLDDFAADLNRQILNNLSRILITDQFGEEGLQEGTYILGSYEITVGQTNEGLSVTIFDSSTGNQTDIVIPYF
jgi:curli production assembly/transport component CsgF